MSTPPPSPSAEIPLDLINQIPWASFTPMIGVILGALISAVVGHSQAKSAHIRTRERLLADARQREYFLILESLHSLLAAFDQFGQAQSGMTEYNPRGRSTKDKEANQKDADGARAIEDLMSTLDHVRLQVLRVHAIGSIAVKDGVLAVEDTLNEYMLILTSDPSGMFIADTFTTYQKALRENVTNVAVLMRGDLKVDMMYQE